MSYVRLVLAAVLLVGCQDATAPTGPEGSYRLEQVNGGALPFLAEQFGSFRIDILSGSLVLRADQTFSAEITSRQSNAGESQTLTEQAAGTWSRNGSAITFSETGSGAFTGTVVTNGLTAQRAGVTFGFVKQ